MPLRLSVNIGPIILMIDTPIPEKPALNYAYEI